MNTRAKAHITIKLWLATEENCETWATQSLATGPRGAPPYSWLLQDQAREHCQHRPQLHSVFEEPAVAWEVSNYAWHCLLLSDRKHRETNQPVPSSYLCVTPLSWPSNSAVAVASTAILHHDQCTQRGGSQPLRHIRACSAFSSLL